MVLVRYLFQQYRIFIITASGYVHKRSTYGSMPIVLSITTDANAIPTVIYMAYSKISNSNTVLIIIAGFISTTIPTSGVLSIVSEPISII